MKMFLCQGKCFIHYTCNCIHIVFWSDQEWIGNAENEVLIVTSELWDDAGVTKEHPLFFNIFILVLQSWKD